MRPARVLRVACIAVASFVISATGVQFAHAAEVTECDAIDEGRVHGVQVGAPHVLLVIAESYGRSDAVLVRCARTSDGYRRDWSRGGGVGWAGIAPPGAKREGDGRSPSGVFALDRPFGVADPGSSIGYLQLTATSCWDSTIGSARYNTYRDDPSCGPDDERMWDWSAYQYAQGMVIEYNTAPVVPGAGSAIFLHVGGPGTGGCVASDRATVEEIIRTSRAGDVIAIGVRAELVAAPTPAPRPVASDPSPTRGVAAGDAPTSPTTTPAVTADAGAPVPSTMPTVAGTAIATATAVDGGSTALGLVAQHGDGSDPTGALQRSALVLLGLLLALAIGVGSAVARHRRSLVPH